ncbi:unnamed protein product [Phaeothamnion confervicola]
MQPLTAILFLVAAAVGMSLRVAPLANCRARLCRPRAAVGSFLGRPQRLVLRAKEEESGEASTTETEVIATEKPKSASPADLGLDSRGVVSSDKGSIEAYPIDLPAYALLGLSTVVAIAFVGCIFEAFSPTPVLGYVPTYAVGVLSLPGFLFLFYAAIKKGQAESEEDEGY